MAPNRPDWLANHNPPFDHVTTGRFGTIHIAPSEQPMFYNGDNSICIYKKNLEGFDYIVKFYPRYSIKLAKTEIMMLARLQHDNILPLLNVDEDQEGNFLLLLPHYELGDLSSYLHQKPFRGLSWSKTERLQHSIQVLSGLEYLHDQSILHLDLKPANVLLKKGWNGNLNLSICDFDNAIDWERGLKFDPRLMRRTLRYAAYEIYTSDFIGPYTDMYSFGVLLFEVYFNRIAFDKFQENNLGSLHFIMHMGKAYNNLGVDEDSPVEITSLLSLALMCESGKDRVTSRRLKQVFEELLVFASKGMRSEILVINDICRGLPSLSIDVSSVLNLPRSVPPSPTTGDTGEGDELVNSLVESSGGGGGGAEGGFVTVGDGHDVTMMPEGDIKPIVIHKRSVDNSRQRSVESGATTSSSRSGSLTIDTDTVDSASFPDSVSPAPQLMHSTISRLTASTESITNDLMDVITDEMTNAISDAIVAVAIRKDSTPSTPQSVLSPRQSLTPDVPDAAHDNENIYALPRDQPPVVAFYRQASHPQAIMVEDEDEAMQIDE